MAYLCVHALEPKVFQEKLGISLVMWLMFSKYPLMVKDAWDVDLTLKEIPVKEDSVLNSAHACTQKWLTYLVGFVIELLCTLWEVI